MTQNYQAIVKETAKTKTQTITCAKKACKFPQTCKWNQMCMIQGLELSIASKKTLSSPKEEKQECKTKS